MYTNIKILQFFYQLSIAVIGLQKRYAILDTSFFNYFKTVLKHFETVKAILRIIEHNRGSAPKKTAYKMSLTLILAFGRYRDHTLTLIMTKGRSLLSFAHPWNVKYKF